MCVVGTATHARCGGWGSCSRGVAGWAGPLTWATHLGMLPGTLVFTFIGTRISSLKVFADEGAGH